MKRIAIMGDADSVSAFSALGFDVFTAEDVLEAPKLLRRLASGNYAIIYITEHLMKYCTAQMQHYAGQPVPAIIPIPGAFGNTGAGLHNLKLSVIRAIGSDIIGIDDKGKGGKV